MTGHFKFAFFQTSGPSFARHEVDRKRAALHRKFLHLFRDGSTQVPGCLAALLRELLGRVPKGVLCLLFSFFKRLGIKTFLQLPEPLSGFLSEGKEFFRRAVKFLRKTPIGI